jgi:hypothetical protein
MMSLTPAPAPVANAEGRPVEQDVAVLDSELAETP